MSRLFWFLLGAAACFVWLRWKTIKSVIDNRQTIDDAGRIYDGANAVRDVVGRIFG